MNDPTRLALISALAALVAACGGNDNGDGQATPTAASPAPAPSPSPAPAPSPSAATVTGKFIDSAVSNLGYACGTGANATSGVTFDQGQFDYVPPASGAAAPACTFSVGGVVLGTAAAGPIVTPFDLVPGASANDAPLNTAVVNIARFLQSIDSDGDATNGILIQHETNVALAGKSLDFASPNFDTQAAALLASAGKTLVSAAAAGDALQATMRGLYAGNYSCTYSAVVNGQNTVLGNVAVTISGNGTITGSGTPTYPTVGSSFDVEGSLTPGGIFGASTSTGATFDGDFTSADGTAATTKGDGHWSDASLPPPGGGTWHCDHQ
jgi:hypothetical protein